MKKRFCALVACWKNKPRLQRNPVLSFRMRLELYWPDMAFFLNAALPLLMLLTALVLPVPQALADTQQSKKNDLAERYYRDCIRRADTEEKDILNEELRQSVCSCTAAMAAKGLSLQDLEGLFPKSRKNQSTYDLITVEFYAPCSSHVAANLVFDECLKNPVTMAELNHPWHVCKCASRKMEAFTKEKAADLYATFLAYGSPAPPKAPTGKDASKNTDPLPALITSPIFASKTEGAMEECISQYEFGFR